MEQIGFSPLLKCSNYRSGLHYCLKLIYETIYSLWLCPFLTGNFSKWSGPICSERSKARPSALLRFLEDSGVSSWSQGSARRHVLAYLPASSWVEYHSQIFQTPVTSKCPIKCLVTEKASRFTWHRRVLVPELHELP